MSGASGKAAQLRFKPNCGRSANDRIVLRPEEERLRARPALHEVHFEDSDGVRIAYAASATPLWCWAAHWLSILPSVWKARLAALDREFQRTISLSIRRRGTARYLELGQPPPGEFTLSCAVWMRSFAGFIYTSRAQCLGGLCARHCHCSTVVRPSSRLCRFDQSQCSVYVTRGWWRGATAMAYAAARPVTRGRCFCPIVSWPTPRVAGWGNDAENRAARGHSSP